MNELLIEGIIDESKELFGGVDDSEEIRGQLEYARENHGGGSIENISKGEGVKSLKFNDTNSNRSFGENSATFGSNNVSGCKGWKIIEINKTTTPHQIVLENYSGGLDVGDRISLKADWEFGFFGTISSITESGILELNKSLPNEAQVIEGEDAYLWCPDKHESGVFSIGFNSFSVGYDNVATNDSTFGSGTNNLADGSHSFVSGKNNEVGYCSASFGKGNSITGQCDIGTGQNQTIKSNNSIGIGFQNEITGENDAAIGLMLHARGNNQTVVGKYNEDKNDALFIVGSGSDDNHRQNAFVVLTNGFIEKIKTQNLFVTTNGAALIDKEGNIPYRYALIGDFVRTYGSNSLAGGTSTDSSTNSIVFGQDSKIDKYLMNCALFGLGLRADPSPSGPGGQYLDYSNNSTIIGKYNAPLQKDDLFLIGGGDGNNNRRNVFHINKYYMESRVPYTLRSQAKGKAIIIDGEHIYKMIDDHFYSGNESIFKAGYNVSISNNIVVCNEPNNYSAIAFRIENIILKPNTNYKVAITYRYPRNSKNFNVKPRFVAGRKVSDWQFWFRNSSESYTERNLLGEDSSSGRTGYMDFTKSTDNAFYTNVVTFNTGNVVDDVNNILTFLCKSGDSSGSCYIEISHIECSEILDEISVYDGSVI